MKVVKYILIGTFLIASAASYACPKAVYKSTFDEVYLHLEEDFTVEVRRGKKELIYSGAIQGFSMDSKYEWFQVVPADSSFGNIGQITLGGTCEFIKIFWREGKPEKGNGTNYFMKRIPNNIQKYTSRRDAPVTATLYLALGISSETNIKFLY